MVMRLLRAWALLLGLFPALAFAQGQIGAGQVMGNSTAAKATPAPSTVTAILDQALGSTRGSILRRGAAAWGIVAPSATVGLPWVSAGTGADPLYQALTVAGGGTGITTLAIGDLLQASSTSALARLAAVATGNVLLSGGIGVVSSWGKVTSSHLNITTSTCTNQFVTAISATGTGTCTTATLASAQFANQGTTTTLLHGNAAGNPAFGGLAYADILAAALATGANLEAGAANTLLNTNTIYDGEQTITFAATQTWDFNTFLNARETLTANITSLTCSNIKASQSGVISLVQDGTGSRTMVAGWCSQFRWAGGTRGILTTTASAIDALFYQCVSTSICYVSLSKAQAN